MTITLAPENEEKLREAALREGQDAAALANAILADVLAQRAQEFEEDIAAVQEAWVAVREGRERPFAEYMAEHRRRYPDAAPASALTASS